MCRSSKLPKLGEHTRHEPERLQRDEMIKKSFWAPLGGSLKYWEKPSPGYFKKGDTFLIFKCQSEHHGLHIEYVAPCEMNIKTVKKSKSGGYACEATFNSNVDFTPIVNMGRDISNITNELENADELLKKIRSYGIFKYMIAKMTGEYNILMANYYKSSYDMFVLADAIMDAQGLDSEEVNIRVFARNQKKYAKKNLEKYG